MLLIRFLLSATLSLLSTMVSLLSVGCHSGGMKAGASRIGGGSGVKWTLAQWSAAGGNWVVSLDAPSANLSGTPFTLVFTFTDATQTSCVASLLGSQATGSLNIATCTAASTGLANSTGATAFETGGAGTYANSGVVLTLCKSGGSPCQAYQ